VLAGHEVGTVLLDAAGRDEDRLLPGPHRVAHLEPGQVLDEDRVDGVDGTAHVRVGRHGRGRSAGLLCVCRKRGQDQRDDNDQ
jgi:hypothetical protein